MKKFVFCVLIMLMIVLALGGCAKKTNASAQKDIETQIENMIGISEESSERGAFEVAIGNNSLFSDDEYGRKISQKVNYEIESIEIEGESGIAVLIVEAPNIYQLLKESAAEIDNEDNVDLLVALVSQKLDGNYTEIRERIECEIKFENEKWSLVMNTELLDALSGNLYSAYFRIADSVIENLEEG